MPDEFRDKSKVEFMRWLFSDARGMTEYDKAIQKEFPDIWEIVQDRKKRYKKVGSNYAVELQKIEATIFIDGIGDIFSEGVLSVHDSLYFKESLESEVREVLESSLIENGIRCFRLG